MPKLNVYNLEAKEIREIELAEAVFGIEPNQQVMFDALIMQRANMRQGTHDTKSRHEVSGGGKKPWVPSALRSGEAAASLSVRRRAAMLTV